MSQSKPIIRCAVYTRKSHEEGLDQEFNSLDAQRQAAEAYVESQRHEGWRLLPDRYDDGGFSGGNMERPALARLLSGIRAGKIDCVVVYKVDRLSRSLLDFAQLIALFDQHEVSFVSVTQQFNTTTSMGRLTLNILLSFAQFEREIIGERIRDKKLATARQGKYIGGQPKLGLDIVDRRYVVNSEEAKLVRRIFEMLLEHESCRKVAESLNAEGLVTKQYETKTGKSMGGNLWKGRNVYDLVTDRKYLGQIVHKGIAYDGEHPAIVDATLFDKVQEVLRANKTYTHKHQVQRFALLRGLLRCGHCGSLIQPSWTKNHGREYRYYTCAKRVKTGYGNCPLPTLPAGEIEQAIIAEVRTLLRHPEVIARTLREIDRVRDAELDDATRERLESLRGRREQVQHSIRTALSASKDNRGFLAEEAERLGRELELIEHEIRKLEPGEAAGEDFDEDKLTGALRRVDPVWEVLFPEEQRRILALLVESITVRDSGVEIRLHANGIEQIVEELDPVDAQPLTGADVPPARHPGVTTRHEQGAVVVHIPMRFHRRNGRQKVVTAELEKGDQDDDALLAAISKAYRWQSQLESGEHASVEELAKANKVDRSYAARLLRLNSLAPDIVEAVLTGRPPEGVSLRVLHKGIPLSWDEQRQLWPTA